MLVTIKFAQTVDGRIATSTGNSRWISGPEAREFAHRLRSQHDAVMVGVGTVLADDPSLTVRHVPGRNPRRVVVDTRLRTPIGSAVLNVETGSAILAVGGEAARSRGGTFTVAGAEIVVVPLLDGHANLEILFDELARRNLHSVLIEGGSRLITAILRARLADRAVIISAPIIIGKGIDSVGDLEIGTIADAIQFHNVSYEVLGRDLVFRGDISRT